MGVPGCPHPPMISNIVDFVNNVRIIVIQANWMLHGDILITFVANLKLHSRDYFSTDLLLLHIAWVKQFSHSSAFVYLRGNCTGLQLDNIVNRIQLSAFKWCNLGATNFGIPDLISSAVRKNPTQFMPHTENTKFELVTTIKQRRCSWLILQTLRCNQS